MNTVNTCIKITPPDQRFFYLDPQPDITAFELALCMDVWIYAMSHQPPGPRYDALPESAKRHWRIDGS